MRMTPTATVLYVIERAMTSINDFGPHTVAKPSGNKSAVPTEVGHRYFRRDVVGMALIFAFERGGILSDKDVDPLPVLVEINTESGF